MGRNKPPSSKTRPAKGFQPRGPRKSRDTQSRSGKQIKGFGDTASQSSTTVATERRHKRVPAGDLPPLPKALVGGATPIALLELAGWPDYALLDSGDGQKLEQYGPVRTVRPEPQALWRRRLPVKEWEAAQAVFTGNTEEEGPGRWALNEGPPSHWQMGFRDVAFTCRFTSFRHVGVFPEQATHWAWMVDRIASLKQSGRTPKILNLFGYTGVASLVAAASGAEVTHVDASKKSVAWARENQALSSLDEAPIRWIVDDALKFTEREARRGNLYDGVILDPPKYGRGPAGEVWQLFDHLPTMLKAVSAVLKPEADFVILTAYSIRASFLSMEELMRDIFMDRLATGTLDAGELVIREADLDGLPTRRLSTSLYCRYRSKRRVDG